MKKIFFVGKQIFRIKNKLNLGDVQCWEIRTIRAHAAEASWKFLSPDLMEIDDINVRNDSEPPDSSDSVMELLMKSSFQKTPKDAKNFREQGLGSKILELLVELARENNIKTVCGSIVAKDLKKNGDLIKWYEKRGFIQGLGYEGCIGNADTWVYFNVERQPSSIR
jgi:hypothetical protein